MNSLRHALFFLFTIVLLAFSARLSAQIEDPPTWTATSANGSFSVSLSPREAPVPVAKFHHWTVAIKDRAQRPVYPARIAVSGGMPGHGHGMPSQPQVTRHLGDGVYLIEGMKFNMSGQWVLSLGIESPRQRDRVRVELTIGQLPTGQWSAAELRLLKSLTLSSLGEPPAAPSNRVANDPRAARFGQKLFFETRLSGNGELSCASCHQPDRYFTDGLPRGVGVSATGRNTPTVVGSAYATWLYWDGRRDSLWSQALIPFEAAAEMGSSRVAVVRLIGTDESYRKSYEAVFGAMPDDVVDPGLPVQAGPYADTAARDAWYRLPQRTQQLINSVYANIGKAVAAYERTLRPQPTPFDRYVASLLDRTSRPEVDPLSRAQIAGLKLFIDPQKTQCLQCHNGPLLTNGSFHNIGSGNFNGANLDFGRELGLQAVLMDEFNCIGPYSDALPEQCSALRFLNRDAHSPLRGAFKTPSLRNLSATAPYFHDGSKADLESVIAHYNQPPAKATGGGHELRALGLDKLQRRQLTMFLRALSN